jgi:hypothetical protein
MLNSDCRVLLSVATNTKFDAPWHVLSSMAGAQNGVMALNSSRAAERQIVSRPKHPLRDGPHPQTGSRP